MKIGIPKENILVERRVGLAPAGVDSLVRAGHTVFVQSSAGEGSHFTDEDYMTFYNGDLYETNKYTYYMYRNLELYIRTYRCIPDIYNDTHQLVCNSILYSEGCHFNMGYWIC